VTALVVAMLAYHSTDSRLFRTVDNSLVSAARGSQGPQIHDGGPGPSTANGPSSGDLGPQSPFRPGGLFQLATAQRISPQGSVTSITGTGRLPVTSLDRKIAEGLASAWLRTTKVNGLDYRILTSPLPQGGAIEIGRNISDIVSTLGTLQLEFFVVGLIATVIAALAGVIVARAITRPLQRLAQTAQRVAVTGDLDLSISHEREDEVGRLALSFRSMLNALKQSQLQQRRLVQDASHELRTPLTSMSANVELLQRYDHLPSPTRTRILGDLRSEMAELNMLVSELIELAVVGQTVDESTQLNLAEVAAGVAARFRTRSGRQVEIITEETTPVLQTTTRQLERTLSNLIDNALKFSDDNTPVTITITASSIEVANEAEPIDETDLPHLFDRFYRAPTSWQVSGSGLGLAIVADFVAELGGTTYARNEPTDNHNRVVVGFTVPVVRTS
jgi:two-component system sensor histidine kinase MprB